MSLIQIGSGVGEYQAGGACDLEEVLWTDAVLSAPAHSLSLTGDPGHDIDAILANQDPQTGRPLRPHRSAIGGYTHVLTAPKCFGVLVGLGIDPRLHHAIHLATQETLRLITLITSVDGTAPDGKTPCGLIAVACLQRLTRGIPKPHPHPHVVVVPLVLLPDGQGYARADLSLLFAHGKLLRGFFRHQLGARTAELGYPVHRVGSSFSIRGFPPQTVTRFSVSVEELSSRRKHDLTRRRDVDYETIQAGWRAELSPETLALLKSLRRGAASSPSSPLASVLSSTADRLLANQFSAPVVDVVHEALLEMIGQAAVPCETVAEWLLKGLPSDTKRICTGPAGDLDLTRPEWLAAETAILTRLRLLDGANAGWLSPRASAEWWAQPLLHNRQRVAVLSGDFSPADVQQLAESIGVQATVISGPSLAGAATRSIQPKGTMIVSAAEEAPPRLLAEVVLGRLDAGGRVLFLRLPRKRTARSWLRKLELYAGVPVFYPPEAGRLNTILEPVPLPIRLQCKSADPIDVVAGWVRRGTPTVLVCELAEVDRQTTAVRNKLAALGVLRRGRPVARLARTTAPLGPGMVVQSARNHGFIRANERLTIVSVQGDGVTVQRPSGFLAMIPQSAALGFERFTQTRSDLRAAEHIFFTRSGATPEKRRVRAGQWDMVRDVRADGTVTLRSGRTLGPGYGHWHYRYCVAADGPVLPAVVVVVGASDLPNVVAAGWLSAPRRVVLVCAEDENRARQVVRATLPPGFRPYSPHVAAVGLAAALARQSLHAPLVLEPPAEIRRPVTPRTNNPVTLESPQKT
jgi:hypothetical protein